MKKNLLIIFSAFLILFVLMGSVCALNDNTTSLNQDKILTAENQAKDLENNNILKSDNDNKALKTPVSGQNFSNIQDAINSAESGDEIELSGIYKGSGSEIVINKNNLTFIGNDAVLDAQGLSRIFNITGNGIKLKNIKFINANADKGGAIYWYGADGRLNDCSFINNTAKSLAGAVYWYGTNGSVNSCNFINNRAKMGSGAIQWDSNSPDGLISYSNFTSNEATQKGGAIGWCAKNGVITNCNFKNSVSGLGGAIYWEADVFNGTVNYCSFTNNIGTDGGAIYWFGLNGKVTNCNFTNNTGNNGGALNWQKKYGAINNCNFTNNNAKEKGGAVYWEGTNATASNCNFTYNKAAEGGAVYWYGFNGTLNYCNFENNEATGLESYGGAIAWMASEGSVSDCSFISNSAEAGGAVGWDGDDGCVENCIFKTNKALGEDSYGGAIFWFAVNGVVDNCSFYDNAADFAGGAILWDALNGTLKNCIFINNMAALAGAVGWNATSGIINNCSFINNSALEGGAVYWIGSGNISNSTFKGNTAQNNKNIYLYGNGILNLVNSTLQTIVTINQLPGYASGSSTTVSFTFDDGTNLGGYNLTLLNNNQTLKTFTYAGSHNYNYFWDNLTVGNYSITVLDANTKKNRYITSYDLMEFRVVNSYIKDNNDMNVFYMEGAQFRVLLVGDDGKPVSGIFVTFKVNDIIYNTTSDADGYASILIDWKPDKYTVSTICGNSTVLNTIQVKNVFHTPKNVKVKKSLKASKFKITLEGIKSKITKKIAFKYKGKTKVAVKFPKVLAGKKVLVKFKGKYFNAKVNSKGKGVLKISKKVACELKLKKGKKYKAVSQYKDSLIYKNKPLNVKINGKTYTVKTNKKGEASFKITSKMVKNLKVGKKYPYYVEFGEDTAKGNLVIKK